MPYKANEKRRHKIPKARYRVKNWRAYDTALRRRGIDTVIITGTLTNVCCESSGRDAAMMDFKTIMVSDANAALTDEAHLMTLTTFIQTFGDVRSTDEMIGMLHAGRSRQAMRA